MKTRNSIDRRYNVEKAAKNWGENYRTCNVGSKERKEGDRKGPASGRGTQKKSSAMGHKRENSGNPGLHMVEGQETTPGKDEAWCDYGSAWPTSEAEEPWGF